MKNEFNIWSLKRTSDKIINVPDQMYNNKMQKYTPLQMKWICKYMQDI
jgi:hypothetical protein